MLAGLVDNVLTAAGVDRGGGEYPEVTFEIGWEAAYHGVPCHLFGLGKVAEDDEGGVTLAEDDEGGVT